MGEYVRKFARRLLDRRRKGEDRAPPLRRLHFLAMPFVQLREADQSEEVALVDGKRLLQRFALGLGIAKLAISGGEIDQKFGGRRVGLTGLLEIFGRRQRVSGPERFESEPIRLSGIVRGSQRHHSYGDRAARHVNLDAARSSCLGA